MTNEQAIKLLQHCGAEAHCRHFIATGNCDGCNMMTALNMAIEALSEPKTKCIAQIRINRDDIEDLVNEKVNEIVETMSEPKTGKPALAVSRAREDIMTPPTPMKNTDPPRSAQAFR